MTKYNKVSVIGLGYIGLPTAAMFASRGLNVLGIDLSRHVVETINKGDIHIVEPDLDMIVKSAVSKGKLRASQVPETADVFIISVPTPFTVNHEPDLSFIMTAVKNIAPFIKKGNLVILESTCPVGTTEQLSNWLKEERNDLSFPTDKENSDIHIAHCPERVLPGNIMRELVTNDRIIGGITKSCALIARQLYQTFVTGNCHISNARTAELTKLIENSYRDVNIAFANELSLVSKHLEIDVWEVIELANKHPRVNILSPGPGVGGHCIAVDPWFVVSSAPEQSRLIRAAREVNDSMPNHVVTNVIEKAKSQVSPTIAFLGITYKANIDDMRESPALEIVKKVASILPSDIIIVEPNITELSDDLLKNRAKLTSLENGISEASIVVVLVEHKEFLNFDVTKLTGKTIIDTKGIWLSISGHFK